jgi:hypothetical protein
MNAWLPEAVVEVALVDLAAQCRMAEEAEAPEPVVEADHHHALPREARAGVGRRRAAAVDEAAAVDPDDDRQLVLGLGARPRGRAPDVGIYRQSSAGAVPSGAASLGKGSCMQSLP